MPHLTTFFRECKVLCPLFPSYLSIAVLLLFSTVPRLSVLSLSILLSVLLFFLFSSLCYCVLFLLCISVSSLSLPPVDVLKMRKIA